MIVMTGHFPHIIQLSYAVEPELLYPHLPPGIELDFFNSTCYISLVGLQPLDLRVMGIPVPWFRHRAQVNLRFYVRRGLAGETRRHGVVFIRQLIPHRLVAWGARLLYHEPAEALPVDCTIEKIGHQARQVKYSWGPGQQHLIQTAFRQQPLYAASPAEQDFFVDRHWGYCRQKDGSCLEYRFNHPPWKTYNALVAETFAAVGDFYGPQFSEILGRRPDYAFGSRGSNIFLTRGHRL